MKLIAQIESRHRPQIVLFFTRVAHFQRFRRRHKLLREDLGNPGLHDKTLRRRAHLSGVLITTNHRRLYRHINISVIKHDKGIGTAQFEHTFLQRRAGLGTNGLTRAHATGHRYRRHARIVNDLRNAVVSCIDPVKNAGRYTGLRHHLAD
ncbi:Uncharacterised protein [Kluyvera cryocrescens]|nr:Uncharacterised protein [Kluyvera cryocrescens]